MLLSLLPVAPALLALLDVLAATSADFDLALEPPAPVGVTTAADLGRPDREEEEENVATAIVAISGHFSQRDPFQTFQDSRFIGIIFHFIFSHDF